MSGVEPGSPASLHWEHEKLDCRWEHPVKPRGDVEDDIRA